MFSLQCLKLIAILNKFDILRYNCCDCVDH